MRSIIKFRLFEVFFSDSSLFKNTFLFNVIRANETVINDIITIPLLLKLN